MDTNVNEDVDMDLLVDNNPDPEKDYLDNHNKEVVEQDPDPDKVVEADLEMDPAAATESFIRKNFGLSVEDMEEEAEQMEASAEEIIENSEPVTDEDSILGIEPAAPEATTVVVTPPEGGDTTVVEGGDDEGTVVETEATLDVEPDSAAGVASLENLRAIFSREDEDMDDGTDADVSLNVQTPNNDVDIDLEGKAVTIEPNDEDSHEEPDGDEGSVEAPETSDDTSSDDDSDKENSDEGEEDADSSAESWWMI